jgi:Na+-translocating ferredoxin:NAD+ oxidoreductase RNF subunit RnfB
MILDIIVPVAIFLLVGGAAGVILTFAFRALEVELDTTVDTILGSLPGINCAACGYASCEAYAVAVKKSECAPNLCKPGGVEAADAIGKVLGINVEPCERECAFVHCAGATTEEKFRYSGTLTCAASELYYSGESNCSSGCLGYGDCARVCVYNAISFVNRVATVDAHRCWACGLCVTACPNKLITLRKHSERVLINCSSHEMSKMTRAACAHGCIACGLCVKKCNKKAITVVDNCAIIDYDKCNSCGNCIAVCPIKCIIYEKW